MLEKAILRDRKISERFASSFESFSDSLTALRDFVTLIGSLLSERQRETVREHEKEVALLLIAANSISETPSLSDEEVSKLKATVGHEVAVTRNENKVQISMPDKETGIRVTKFVKSIESGGKHQGLLYRSALISLISSAEWFLSQLIRQYFESFENAIGVKEKLLSLQDLQTFGSIDDAKAYLIETRIDEIMRGSFDDWLKYLRENVKLSAAYLNPYKDQLTEVFQRRNVMVHNNGLVHSSYLNKVSAVLRNDVSLGMQLSVAPEYLEKSIDLIERNFLLLGAELWKQLDPKDDGRGSVIVAIAFNRLSEEHWEVAEGLSFFLKNDRQLAESYQMIGLLNYWQSIKWQNRFGEVEAEIKNADFSAKDEVYQVARYALLDDISNFMRILPEVVRSGKLDIEKLQTWPIFREVRKAEEFLKFMETQEDKLALTKHEIEEPQIPNPKP